MLLIRTCGGPQGAPPGWYQDPQGLGQRYWDGTRWTDNYSQGLQQPQPQQQQTKSGGMPGSWEIVGCAALVGGTANEIDRSIKEEQNSNAITNEQARSVPLGTPRSEVESDFGPPKSDQESTNEGLGDDTCIYYNIRGGEILDQWQFCFEGSGKSGNADEQEPPVAGSHAGRRVAPRRTLRRGCTST